MSIEELVAAIQAGAADRIGELWERVEGLVRWKAKRIMIVLEGCPGRGVEFEDLYQSGYLAMVAAVDSYKPECGAFSTWLGYHLKTAFADATGYRTQKGRKEPLNNCISLDTPLTDDADSDDLMDVIADPAGLQWQESLEESMWRKELQEAVGTALAGIPDKYADVLRLRHYRCMTYAEIGNCLDVGVERVRQMESKAIRLLRKPSIACELRPFLHFDFYCGTGYGAFQHSGMSIQERYLIMEEEHKELEVRRHQREREKEIHNTVSAMMENITSDAEARVAVMTQEEKRALLEKYGYA
ncbi:MAG: sigma-70 family RNA polymerase sigma factor [Ruminococcaceae bacterium]|nr:sigma-70 family RNA polymerase sigma factor [Oscillospiraceae bacterium]